MKTFRQKNSMKTFAQACSYLTGEHGIKNIREAYFLFKDLRDHDKRAASYEGCILLDWLQHGIPKPDFFDNRNIAITYESVYSVLKQAYYQDPVMAPGLLLRLYLSYPKEPRDIPFDDVLQTALEQNDSLACLYKMTQSPSCDMMETWYEQAQCHAASHRIMAAYYQTRDPQKAVCCLKKAADMGDKEALYHYGRRAWSLGDDITACSCLRQSAEKGYVFAGAVLGDMYNILGNKPMAAQWYRYAVKHGHHASQQAHDALGETYARYPLEP